MKLMLFDGQNIECQNIECAVLAERWLAQWRLKFGSQKIHGNRISAERSRFNNRGFHAKKKQFWWRFV
jgi:hypothetical protein